MKCKNPDCDRENADDAQVCVYCGTPLVDAYAATKALPDSDELDEAGSNWGRARPTERIHLLIEDETVSDKLVIETKDIDELVIGRMDPFTHDAPPIDLTNYGAQDKGVSRRHAALLRRDGSLLVVDKGSPNGTYLNGQRLVAGQPRVLRDGDEVRMGRLTLRVVFEVVTR
jgi:hypothetical protein